MMSLSQKVLTDKEKLPRIVLSKEGQTDSVLRHEKTHDF